MGITELYYDTCRTSEITVFYQGLTSGYMSHLYNVSLYVSREKVELIMVTVN